MNVFIKAETVKEACMQVDLFAPKESGTVELKPSGPGWLATYYHQANYKASPLVIVDNKLDHYVKGLVANKINLAVSWWLIASYAYYLLDENLISDEFFDYLTLLIKENYEQITHENKDLITPERIACGSAFDLRIYPTRVMVCAEQLITQVHKARSA